MMDNDMLKMLGIFLIVAYIIYLAYKSMNMNVDFLEGLENKIKFQNGIAGNAEEYATNIKDMTTKLQDEILITKYRENYENTIINLDDYLNLLMLKTTLNINTNGMDNDDISQFHKLNALHEAKQSLNTVMNYVDTN
jgi:hypothetical protein|tara:strand:- start:56 stop:466 length:411 start_codon:yes stop_codon:yes gene_type:complete